MQTVPGKSAVPADARWRRLEPGSEYRVCRIGARAIRRIPARSDSLPGLLRRIRRLVGDRVGRSTSPFRRQHAVPIRGIGEERGIRLAIPCIIGYSFALAANGKGRPQRAVAPGSAALCPLGRDCPCGIARRFSPGRAAMECEEQPRFPEGHAASCPVVAFDVAGPSGNDRSIPGHLRINWEGRVAGADESRPTHCDTVCRATWWAA